MTEDKNIYWNLLDMFGRLVTNIRFHKSELEEEYVQALSSIRFEKTKNRSQYLQESKYWTTSNLEWSNMKITKFLVAIKLNCAVSVTMRDHW